MLRSVKSRMKTIKTNNLTVYKEFSKSVETFPDKVAIIFEEERWTFTMMADYCNKIANYFSLEGFKKGDTIGLFCDNRPEYVCIWVGLSQLGVCTALINTNLVQDSLVHSLEAAKCKALIFGSNFADTVSQILNRCPSIKLYELKNSENSTKTLGHAVNLSEIIRDTIAKPIDIHSDVNCKDPFLYIYTSGTTGMPKAAIFTQIRYLTLQTFLRFVYGEDGIIYNPMPLYHGLGTMGVAMTLCSGTTVVLKKKFSASQYWKDCAKHDCTVALHIGEMCRYILNSPNLEVPEHKIKTIMGNGLKPDVWVKYVKKFNVKQVLEFYTATEGVIVFINLDNKVGAAGFIPTYLRLTHPTQLVKYDEENEEPIRDSNGLCIRCEVGEPGLALGKIDESHIISTFVGYTDKAQSQKKIVKNVIEIGDAYFNSGDILESDELGYIYFKDRTGDTFRWKGENVATFEVESVISKLTDNHTVVVFGVQIPGAEGKAGMAVIVDPERQLNLSTLSVEISANLPRYSVPMFIRITDNLSLTATYKIKKIHLKADGYDLDKMIFENLLVMVVAVIIVPIAVVRYGWIRNLDKKIKRDVTVIVSLIQSMITVIKVLRQNLPVHKRFECVVKRHPNKAAILFEDEIWNFAKVDELSNKVAIYFEQEGYNQGDCVALLLDNCPDYTSLWMGLSKIGVVTSLLNINLGIDSLKHSIEIVNCKAIIFGSSYEEKINSIMSEIPLKGYIFKRFNETASISSNHINLTEELSVIDPKKSLKDNYKILASDPLLYIYTSGTTGLPKAAIISHYRYSLFLCTGKLIFKDTNNLIIYCPMPLYHGSGVALGIGQMVLSGATVALRKKFSASNYWKDCKRYNCNAAQYIGEMLRYVLVAPDNQNVNYSLEVMYGNGLKPLVWKQFVEKFKVKRMLEFYAATEGTFGLYNVDNTVGNIGYFPSYLRKFLPFKLIRVSEGTGEPITNDNGFCIQCQENEPGLAIGKLGHKDKSLLSFQGYTDRKETSKKILRDVFKKGDTYFNSGDVLSFDHEGYYYFVDRLGDTFRWKGENVSTTEIESIISKIIGLNDAAVYGVQIPGTEGRAGMVSLINTGGNLDMDFLLSQFQQNIASYAIPIFVRIISSLPMTSTFKLQKFNLRREGFNINVVTDPIYFYDPYVKKYVLLTDEIYNNIIAGNIRI
ncbi:hypothetical protein FQR65_LT11494 [Abscondita terminalis]|nr:hypothetical protein FQR65_LT11494 [Abscondita terminalis]